MKSGSLLPKSVVPLRIGFVPLIDAAPLIVAAELNYFADEGLSVTLERQVGWGNVRDKLTFGQLDIAHALLGMPLLSVLGNDWFGEPLVSVMSLGSGGNAITLSRRLIEQGVNSAAKLAQWLRHTQHRPTMLAHVFSCSMHHYLLREWLHGAEIDPDLDVRLCVLPPPQMPSQMMQGYLDGFCVGEPWNTLASREGSGSIVSITTDILPAHPEKVLAVSRQWAQRHASLLPRLIRAVLRGCAYCDDAQHVPELSRMLSQPKYIDTTAEVLAASLILEQSFLSPGQQLAARATDWRPRSFAADATYPSATHPVWLANQMIRWGHLAHDIDLMAVAAKCVDSDPYREAARSMGIALPPNDFAPMRLRNGWFDPTTPLEPKRRATTGPTGSRRNS